MMAFNGKEGQDLMDELVTRGMEFELAQQQALELFLSHCVDELYPGESSTLPAARGYGAGHQMALKKSSIMDKLAQACADTSDQLQDMSTQDVAEKLQEAVAATRQSLQEVRLGVNEIMQDPRKFETIEDNADSEGERFQRVDEDSNDEHFDDMPALIPVSDIDKDARIPENTKALFVMMLDNDESLRDLFAFSSEMCGVLDNALGTISQDEYELAAHLSLSIAQKLLEVGEAMFTSIGEETRLQAGIDDRSERITIEELDGDGQTSRVLEPKTPQSRAAERLRKRREQRKQAKTLRSYVVGLSDAAKQRAAAHPAIAALIGTITLPFIGLALPVASMVGLAVVLEKYFPEHAALTLELCRNFVQMAKLSFLLLKVSARQVASVAKHYIRSWHHFAKTHGYAAAGREIITTGFAWTSLGVMLLYTSIFGSTKPHTA